MLLIELQENLMFSPRAYLSNNIGGLFNFCTKFNYILNLTLSWSYHFLLTHQFDVISYIVSTIEF